MLFFTNKRTMQNNVKICTKKVPCEHLSLSPVHHTKMALFGVVTRVVNAWLSVPQVVGSRTTGPQLHTPVPLRHYIEWFDVSAEEVRATSKVIPGAGGVESLPQHRLILGQLQGLTTSTSYDIQHIVLFYSQCTPFVLLYSHGTNHMT